MNKGRSALLLRLCRRTSTKHSLQTAELLLFLNHQRSIGTAIRWTIKTVYAKVAERFPNLEKRSLMLRGKEAPTDARVLGAA